MSFKINTTVPGNFNYFMFSWLLAVAHLVGHHAWPRVRISVSQFSLVTCCPRVPAPTQAHLPFSAWLTPELCGPTDLLTEEMRCVSPVLLQAKSSSLTCVANKDGLQTLERLPLCEEAFQVCPGSFQGFSFLSSTLVVEPALYLLFSRKVDSK